MAARRSGVPTDDNGVHVALAVVGERILEPRTQNAVRVIVPALPPSGLSRGALTAAGDDRPEPRAAPCLSTVG